MDSIDLGLRFSYHIYKTRKIKYRYFDQIKNNHIEELPASLKEVLFSEETSLFVDNEKKTARQLGFSIYSFYKPSYPKQIKHFNAMPPCLYVQGKLDNIKHSIAIVGSRKATSYGLSNAFSFEKGLASNHFTIISGLALGIDAQAHRGALDIDGITVGVLGCSLDHSYPKANDPLRKKIANHGAIISEFPFNTPPAPYLFPVRNRIISALSDEILVIEAAKKSGALITADYALEQGKEVYALPGNITNPLNQGCHTLIKNGAVLIDSWKDLLPSEQPELFQNHESSVQSFIENPLEEELLNLLKVESLSMGELIENCKVTASSEEILQAVTMLEVNLLIEQIAGKYTLKNI